MPTTGGGDGSTRENFSLKGNLMNEKKLDLKAPAPPADRAFTIWESSLPQKIGLNKDEIRALRKSHLIENEHWQLSKKRLLYSLEGVQRLYEVAGVAWTNFDKNAAPSANVEDAGPIKAPEPITLIVFRDGLKNPKVIEAHFPDQDPGDPKNRMIVRVKKSGKFTVGMEIPVTELRPGIYELARPCPRTKGRW